MTCHSSKMELLRFYIAVKAGFLGLFPWDYIGTGSPIT